MRPATRHAIVVSLVWIGLNGLLFWLVTASPRLWAAQPQPNAAYAMPIVGIGLFALLTIVGPWVIRSPVGVAVVAITIPIAIRIAAGLAGQASPLAWIELAAKLELWLAVIATIWAFAPRCRLDRRLVWALLVTVSLGAPSFAWLTRDYGGSGAVSLHDLPHRLLTTTFLHE